MHRTVNPDPTHTTQTEAALRAEYEQLQQALIQKMQTECAAQNLPWPPPALAITAEEMAQSLAARRERLSFRSPLNELKAEWLAIYVSCCRIPLIPSIFSCSLLLRIAQAVTHSTTYLCASTFETCKKSYERYTFFNHPSPSTTHYSPKPPPP